MLALPVITTVHPEMRQFATAARPLRPSRVGKFLRCPMSVVLQMAAESAGNAAAQTGNLVHDAVEAYHKTKEAREAAGLAALERARAQFPEGDAEKAKAIFARYAKDPRNQNAVVPWVEAPVTLTLAPAPNDPTGKPVVISGTLDQVRLEDGVLRVWDVKTGDRLSGDESEAEYLIQQATYTLAAIQTLDPSIQPGGLIYTPAYEKSRSKPFRPLKLTADRCKMLILPLVYWVAAVRSGVAPFSPSPEACRFCDEGGWPRCASKAENVLGVKP
jgi:hypothetical protein